MNGSGSMQEAMQKPYRYQRQLRSFLISHSNTKAAVEQMLNDLRASAQGDWRIACLRYFNPVGAHPSGRIVENPLGIPNNLFSFVSQVAVGRRARPQVFGGDRPTPVGTGVRDTIHVMELAEGYRAALNRLLVEKPQLLTLNLGSGQGKYVLEVVQAMKAASGRSIPYAIIDRRLVMPPSASPIPAKPLSALAGALREALKRFAATTGHGNTRTSRDMSQPAQSLPTKGLITACQAIGSLN
ncbi:UDP-glucose 4-epimerase [Synechococcus sp. RS9915]|nr:UDP-glucose 4-epimerase [Synechococcus sp. RS9915]